MIEILWGSALMIETEAYMPLKQPLLPMRMLRRRNYVAVVIVGTVGQMIYFALAILWPQQIAALYTTSNSKIGIMSVRIIRAEVSSEILTICLMELW
jgi:hypothetical protein